MYSGPQIADMGQHLKHYLFLKSQAQEPPPGTATPAEGALVGRGRQKGAPGPFTGEGTISPLFRIFLQWN